MTEVDYFDWRGFLQRWVGGCAKCCQGFERDFYMQEMGQLCLEAQIFGDPNLLGHQIEYMNWL